jgi:DNA adenine methylase
MTVKVPPLKCQGIKTKLVEWIKDHSALASDGMWIEPFMGSGVVGFNVRPSRAIFADVNPHIINFYNAIKQKSITAGIKGISGKGRRATPSQRRRALLCGARAFQ